MIKKIFGKNKIGLDLNTVDFENISDKEIKEVEKTVIEYKNKVSTLENSITKKEEQYVTISKKLKERQSVIDEKESKFERTNKLPKLEQELENLSCDYNALVEKRNKRKPLRIVSFTLLIILLAGTMILNGVIIKGSNMEKINKIHQNEIQSLEKMIKQYDD